MVDKEATVWGIHAGRSGEADHQFLHGNCVALGWHKTGDLAALAADRDAFRVKLVEAYPEKTPAAVSNNVGQLYRFVHEMKTGDVIVYPSQRDRQVHIGRVDGPYSYSPGKGDDFPHVRVVKWLKAFPRTRFTQGALYEIGSAMSFFQIRNNAEEYLKALQETGPVPPVGPDDTAGAVAADIEQATRDFVLKQLARELKGHPLADFVAHLLGAMGYRTRVSPEGPDGGIDVIAHKDELGFEPPLVKVQVKSSEGSVGDPAVSALYGKVGANEFGLLVTLGTITLQARNFARSKSNLRLIDGDELVDLVLQHYEELDPRYKGLIPLKRVYIPEPLEEE